MKSVIAATVLCCCLGSAAQHPGVEESTWNIQTGTLGVWANNESRLLNSVALRTEVGLDAGLFMGGIYDSARFHLSRLGESDAGLANILITKPDLAWAIGLFSQKQPDLNKTIQKLRSMSICVLGINFNI
jgi:hypothetical protein